MEYRLSNLPKGRVTDVTETEFYPAVTKNEKVIVHIYNKYFKRCKILHRHMVEISKVHNEVNFIRVDECPFLVETFNV